MLPEGIRHACHWLQSLPFAQEIAESEWLFPTIETIHVLAFVLVVGSIAAVDLRLLGLRDQGHPASRVIRDMLPWTWSAFGVAALAGSLLFASKAVKYAENFPFQLKILCLGLAAINMMVFHSLGNRRLSEWDMTRTPIAAKLAGGVSLALWITIVAAGRWIGFTT
jgi:hypothetical protein